MKGLSLKTDRIRSATIRYQQRFSRNERPSESGPPRRRRWIRRIGAGVVGIATFIAVQFFSPPINEASTSLISRAHAYVFGVDHPIELSPICQGLGGIAAPHAEKDAAYHYRCKRSKQTIAKEQIEQRCRTQWGADARLVLIDPDSASGWTCRTPGVLR